jgi:hypothetical protein
MLFQPRDYKLQFRKKRGFECSEARRDIWMYIYISEISYPKSETRSFGKPNRNLESDGII